MGKRKRLPFIVMPVVLLVLLAAGGASASPIESYVYNSRRQPVRTPNPYTLNRYYTGAELGTGALVEPEDLFVGQDQAVYIADSGNNRIVILEADFTVRRVVDAFNNQGAADGFKTPGGVFVSRSGWLYVADTGNERIVVLDENDRLVRLIGRPDSDVIREDFAFKPNRLAVDRTGRVFAVGPGIVEGIMEFDAQGEFVQFTGSNAVKPDLIRYFWTRIVASEAQAAQSALFIPEEYTSLDIDGRGFLYTASFESYLKKMNTKGDDITTKNSDLPPEGDYTTGALIGEEEGAGAGKRSVSKFVDITVDENGVYSALDSANNRIFAYDYEGNMLWAFGSTGELKGSFLNPVALDYFGEHLLVLDRTLGRVNLFELTAYGRQVRKGVDYRFAGENELSADAWAQVLKINAGSELSYSGIGKIQLSSGRYREAMDSFRLAGNKTDYSKAYKEYRKEQTRRALPAVITALVAGCVALAVVMRLTRARRLVRAAARRARAALPRERSLKTHIRYAFHTMVHPFDGYYEIKHRKEGGVAAATLFIGLFILLTVIRNQATGFLFNSNNLLAMDLFGEIRTIFSVLLIFCIANWALTTLMDGEGSFRDIYILCGYALLPVILVTLPAVLLSNVLILEEGAFLSLLYSFSYVWTGFLFFAGILVTHNYTVSKNIATIVLTFAAIGVLLFLGLVAVQMIEWVYNFIVTVVRELYYRA